MDEKSYDQVSKFFQNRLEKELGGVQTESAQLESRAYDDFKQQYMPKHLSFYEKICQFAEKVLPISPDKKTIPKLQEAINTCHLNTSPVGVYSTSFLIPLIILVGSLLAFFLLPVAVGGLPNMFFVIFSLIVAVSIILPLQNLPYSLANQWRMKASNQMVLCVFYMVTYMRHTSNLENAINFSAEHLGAPLSLDMRKIMWDVETQKYDSVKDSLDDYLLRWKDHAMEFIESVHLIQSSLYESTEDRRLNSLDKALTVILNETYEKMLHFAHNLKGPLVTLNMLGVVLPILTLVILPLVVSFMDNFRWYHLFAMYNIALPSLVYLLGKNILSTRPGGGGESDITEKNKALKKYQNIVLKMGKKETYIQPAVFVVSLGLILLFVGFLPLIWQTAGLPDYGIVQAGGRTFIKDVELAKNDGNNILYYFLGVREAEDGREVGPFGVGAMLMSILVPLALGLSVGLYFKYRSKNIVKIRDQAKKLELEFSSALFQLGNRIGDGLPAEIAFGKVADMMPDTTSGKFFNLVNVNIVHLGMGVEQAIFDKEKGALKYYPSDLIESSMKVLVESSKKGPIVASQALINVSDYIKQMHRVDERLKDLMGDVISGMKSQAMFLTPVISGIVVGITSMITKILGTLGSKINELGAEAGGIGAGGGGILQLFGVGIPTFHFQIVVGLYVVQLAYILTVIGNGIESGADRVGEEAALGAQMTKSVMLYAGISFVIILVFNVVATGIMNNISTLG